MSREEYIIRERRAARGYVDNTQAKKSFMGKMTTQFLVCIIIFGVVMGMGNIGGLHESIKYYLNYTVDYKASVEGIVDRCRNLFMVDNDA